MSKAGKIEKAREKNRLKQIEGFYNEYMNLSESVSLRISSDIYGEDVVRDDITGYQIPITSIKRILK